MATSTRNQLSTPAINVTPIVVHVNVVKTLSGATWCASFPGSASTDDLEEPFKANFLEFLRALKEAGASTHIAATFRPVERAYMMRFCYLIKHKQHKPQKVPTQTGVNIEWDHGDDEKSIAAACEMSTGFDIDTLGTTPAWNSQHTIGFAVDMRISWKDDLSITQKDGTIKIITTSPKDRMNTELHEVGATYGVIKYNGPNLTNLIGQRQDYKNAHFISYLACTYLWNISSKRFTD